ncbi:MAG TPA: glycosyltransferase [Blastocatellia bacterium]|nr:glycosyltransferase [Blastocatellia bacterium]HMV84821.1 glycosyltransferase [Blastocatellia bacterium]HMX26269.1 glycosyltransferase [Blastocatellia bacterium]HMY73713.1 glycosyltransferase [Blastocatellia bacterium]HMZ21164.1 glycosyltransferase [Blastocatellia bacterium]
MIKPPTISVIVIFYNAEKFLAAAVESVLAQTCEDWELLLVDDGSSDGSSEIAKSYVAAQPEKVYYLEHEGHRNQGMSATRNLGISRARGRYLALLDADDVWLPHKLAEQAAILDAHPDAVMVYGKTRYWYGWTGRPEDEAKDYTPALGVKAESLIAPPALLGGLLHSTVPTPCPSDIMIRREAAIAVGGFEVEFKREYQLFEDQAFLAKVYLRDSVFVSGQSWFLYRRHPNSCMATMTDAKLKRVVGLYYFKWLENYLNAQGVKDKRLWQALAQKRRRYSHPWLAALRAQAKRIADAGKRLARQALPVGVYEWVKRRKQQCQDKLNYVSIRGGE